MILTLTSLAVILPVLCAHSPPSYGGGGYYPTSWEGLTGSNYLPSNNWAEANWPPQNVGVALVPQAPDEEMKELLDSISVDRELST
jgi:hypothetical protein